MRELDLLQHIYGRNAGLADHVLTPPGDDMAVVRIGRQSVLVAVDQLADGVHFDAARTPLEWIGRKAITRNLSDVAAMAALPVAAVAAACLPRDLGRARAERLFDAMADTAESYGCPLVGGDISIWDHPLMLSVTIFAEPAGIEPVLRSGARPGDVVCATGALGGAWAASRPHGLHDEDHAGTGEGSGGGVRDGGGAEGGNGGAQPHLIFEPRVALARKLASIEGLRLRAMIDLSDGLAGDLSRICEQSGVAAEIHTDALPLRPQAHAAAGDGRPAWMHALTDGEDYELCFTIDPADADARLPAEIDGVSIRRVGRILDRGQAPADSRIWLRRGAHRQPLDTHGWEHTG